MIVFFSIICFIFLHAAVEDFYEDRVLTTIDSFTYPVEKVQYPTLTICPPEYEAPKEYNEWWFIRAAFNQYKFFCNNKADCDDTQKLRADYSAFLGKVATKVLELTPVPNDRWLR